MHAQYRWNYLFQLFPILSWLGKDAEAEDTELTSVFPSS